eukprot:4430766-Amphidinium_carterae.1
MFAGDAALGQLAHNASSLETWCYALQTSSRPANIHAGTMQTFRHPVSLFLRACSVLVKLDRQV